MASEFFAEGGSDISLTITPGDSGVLQVIANGEMIFDRKAEDGRYPDLPRVKQMRAAIRDMLAVPVAADD